MSTNWTDELSQQMEHHEVEAPAGLWEGIEQGLKAQKRVRRAKLVWPWRIGTAAAVVAGAVASVQLWENSRNGVVGDALTDVVTDIEPTAHHSSDDGQAPDGSGMLVQVKPFVSVRRETQDISRAGKGRAAIGEEMAVVEPEEAELRLPVECSLPQQSGSVTQKNESATSEDAVKTSGKSVQTSEKEYASSSSAAWPQTGRRKGRSVSVRYGRGGSAGNKYAMNLQLMSNARYVGAASNDYADWETVLDDGYRLQHDTIALQSQRREKMPMPSRAQRVIDTSPRYSDHDFPVKVGATVRVPLSRWLSMDAGLSYACLRSDLDFTTSDGVRKVGTVQRVHYIGVPVTLVGNLWENRRWNVYASVGGEVAKSAKTTRRDQQGTVYDGFSRPWQLSVTAAAGVQLNLNKWVGLYVQPSVDYYFDNHSAVQTYYTEHPLTPALRMGLRVRVKE